MNDVETIDAHEAVAIALEWMQYRREQVFDFDRAADDIRPEVLDQLRAHEVPISYLVFADRKYTTIATCRTCGVFMVIGSGGTPPTKCVLTWGCSGSMSAKVKKGPESKERFEQVLIPQEKPSKNDD